MTPEEKQQFLNSGLLDGIKTQEELSGMLKELHSTALEAILQGEMEHHLGYSKHEQNSNTNARNGTSSKCVKTEFGKSQIQVPRDRDGSFEPIVVPKHQSTATPIEKIIISLYAKGMSVSDIEDELQEIYGYKLSTSAISIITDKVNQRVLDWQNRSLESVYCVVWMDGIMFKVRQSGKVINKTIYLAVGLNREGYKELLVVLLLINLPHRCLASYLYSLEKAYNLRRVSFDSNLQNRYCIFCNGDVTYQLECSNNLICC